MPYSAAIKPQWLSVFINKRIAFIPFGKIFFVGNNLD